MATERTGYMQEYVRPPHPTCLHSACERKVKVEVFDGNGQLIGRFCQSDGLAALRDHNRQREVGTAKEATA